MEKKRTVAVFDFDGTLTTKDTFLEFIKYTHGTLALYKGILWHTPWLILMMLHLYPRWKAKQRMFSWFYKGMTYMDFVRKGQDFTSVAQRMLRVETMKLWHEHKQRNSTIYVVSASVEEWVKPFCLQMGAEKVLGTTVEVDSEGKLTGRFLSKNCYGKEKVRRFLEVEPYRPTYYLYAYGDSKGDKEMLNFADEGHFVHI